MEGRRVQLESLLDIEKLGGGGESGGTKRLPWALRRDCSKSAAWCHMLLVTVFKVKVLEPFMSLSSSLECGKPTVWLRGGRSYTCEGLPVTWSTIRNYIAAFSVCWLPHFHSPRPTPPAHHHRFWTQTNVGLLSYSDYCCLLFLCLLGGGS